jgi:hypothetical protein
MISRKQSFQHTNQISNGSTKAQEPQQDTSERVSLFGGSNNRKPQTALPKPVELESLISFSSTNQEKADNLKEHMIKLLNFIQLDLTNRQSKWHGSQPIIAKRQAIEKRLQTLKGNHQHLDLKQIKLIFEDLKASLGEKRSPTIGICKPTSYKQFIAAFGHQAMEILNDPKLLKTSSELNAQLHSIVRNITHQLAQPKEIITTNGTTPLKVAEWIKALHSALHSLKLWNDETKVWQKDTIIIEFSAQRIGHSDTGFIDQILIHKGASYYRRAETQPQYSSSPAPEEFYQLVQINLDRVMNQIVEVSRGHKISTCWIYSA